jgi:hypothetical protein
MALALEVSVAEGYLANAMRQEQDPTLLTLFEKLFIESRSHAARILNLIKTGGFSDR